MADDPTDKDGKDPATAFQNALAKKNGDALQLASQLFDENFTLRGEKRALKGELEEVKKKLPSEGAVVLSAEKAKDYEAYKALGKPDDLKTRIEAHATLETENQELKKKEVLREIADLHGLKVGVLADRDKAAGGLEYEIKADAKDPKRKVAFVKEGDKETPVTEYAETNWADYMPSLKVEQGQTSSQTGRTGTGVDPKPASQNGNAAFQQSHKALAGSGKYGM